jgi:type II secretory pathway predicted ATPase ExeA
MNINQMQKRPVRFFNTTGPCYPWDHYMLPPADRLIDAQLHRYIGDKLYWVLHAPRQTGKTTFLQSWAREINSGNEAVACYVSLEQCQKLPDRERAMPAICDTIMEQAVLSGFQKPELTTGIPSTMVNNILVDWAKKAVPKPLVILFDEADALEGDAMISFLRQLRRGFMDRGIGKFPVSIALVGMRDLKDYITAAKDGVPPSPLSPFNIKEDSIRLGNFSQEEVQKLFSQRTEETGQKITDDALEYVWEQSQGQPWIVNSLFKRATIRVLQVDDYSTATLEHLEKAREQMILARETHLDSLSVRMKEPAIRKMMETLFTGSVDPELSDSDTFRVCTDLGLVRLEKGVPSIANPVYREVLARQATFGAQTMIPEPEWQWEKPDGTLDMDALLREFQVFWRENSEIWEEKMSYTEAFPHLLLMAFLQRVLNGGGNIEREYAAGRGRMDLLVEYKAKRHVIEIKLIHDKKSPETIKTKGLEQTKKYRDTKAPNASAYLVIFDRRDAAKDLSWDERISWQEEVVPGGMVTVVGC